MKFLALIFGLLFVLGLAGTFVWEHLSGQPLATFQATNLAAGAANRFQVRLTPDMQPVKVFFSGSARRTERIRSTGDYTVRISLNGTPVFHDATQLRFKSSGSTTLKAVVKKSSSFGAMNVPAAGEYTVDLLLPDQSGAQTTAAAVRLRRNTSSPPTWSIRGAFAAGALSLLLLVLSSVLNPRRKQRPS